MSGYINRSYSYEDYSHWEIWEKVKDPTPKFAPGGIPLVEKHSDSLCENFVNYCY